MTFDINTILELLRQRRNGSIGAFSDGIQAAIDVIKMEIKK